MEDTVHVKGLAELQKFLDQLPVKLEKSIMRSALRAGAKVIMEKAKLNAPVSTPNAENQRLYGGHSGALRDSLRVSTRYASGKVTASVKAGGVTKKGGDVFYAHFVEYGTRAHIIRAINRKSMYFGGHMVESVQHPGAKPHPFMRPAMDTEAEAALRAVGEKIKQRLTKEGIEGADEVTIGGDDT